ncbi:MAG TPA: YdcF family protein [Negativicutes bacterium]|nr:YdcF family protein [Negativicutes bacterium]
MKGNIRSFWYYFLFALGGIGVLDTLILALFTGPNTGTVVPGLAGCLVIVYIYVKLYIKKGEPVIESIPLRRVVCIFIAAGLLSFILLEGLIIYGGSSNEEIKADYLMILGGGLKKDQITLTVQERLLTGIRYLEEYPEAKVIVSGGHGFGQTVTEAEAMEEYLITEGISADRIISEDRATSTMENFIFSREILERYGEPKDNRLVIVTNDFHMFRSKLLARRNGFEPYGISCSTPFYIRTNCYIREYFALIKSFLFDRL